MRLERVYRALWAGLHRGDEAGLRQPERDVLAHIPADRSVPLTWLTTHLLLPKSTASGLVKSLERQGLVTRERRAGNERELAITLTPEGARQVSAHTVLDLGRLAAALDGIDAGRLEAALATLEAIATRAGSRGTPPPPSAAG